MGILLPDFFQHSVVEEMCESLKNVNIYFTTYTISITVQRYHSRLTLHNRGKHGHSINK